MPEEILFETERRQSRNDVAALLRNAADKLDASGELTLSAGGDSLTLEVPAEVAFEIKVERETGDAEDELSVEFELEWDEDDQTSDGTLSIE